MRLYILSCAPLPLCHQTLAPLRHFRSSLTMSPWQRYTPYLLIPFTFLCILKALYLNHQSTAALYSHSRPKSIQSAPPSFHRITADDNVIIGDQPENIFYFI